MQVTVTGEGAGSAMRVEVGGAVGAAEAAGLRGVLCTAVALSPLTVVDLSATTSLDRAALNACLAAHREARLRGAQLRFRLPDSLRGHLAAGPRHPHDGPCRD
ncbi:hypothetical protein AB0N09_42360 [Streptomyces erythrochromogenes]|uniref:hypothetical protein n=1 Tax=Streptomyces erythrochromogenes TaxID=285574 RepID=UPI003422DC20